MDYNHVEPADLCPVAVTEQWPDTVPVHGITILDAIRPDGHRALHVLHDTDAPIWILVGLLRCVLADLETRWVITDYSESDPIDDD